MELVYDIDKIVLKCAAGDLCILKSTAPTHKCQTCKTAMIPNICDYGRRTGAPWDRDNQFACCEFCMKKQPVQGEQKLGL